jgi:hypothetical protein
VGRETVMNANERLLQMQAALVERGVMDVKFCFASGSDSRPKSEVENGVADFLDAYLNQRYTALASVGDAPKDK